MATVKGNKTVAARILGLDRRTVYRKMRQPQPCAPAPALGEDADLRSPERGHFAATRSACAAGPMPGSARE